MVGRHINDGNVSGKRNNARFGVSGRTYTCRDTKIINPGDEILAT